MDEKKLRKGYNGYELSAQSKDYLLTHITPIHPNIIAHHVTYDYNIYEELPPEAKWVRVIAIANNESVQVVIVKINGTTIREYGNGFYHITISVGRSKGGSPNQSNDLIKDSRNWRAVDPFNIEVIPKFFPF